MSRARQNVMHVAETRMAPDIVESIRWEPRSGGPARWLVVLCHGVGADGSQLAHLASTWAEAVPEAAFVAPHAPFPHFARRLRWLPAVRQVRGREWFSILDRSTATEKAGVRAACRSLDAFANAELRRLSLPPDALVLAGFSQGATMALFTGLHCTAALRGIISCAGALIAPEELRADMKNIGPVLLAHGEADAVVRLVRSRDAERALRAAGMQVQTLYEPGIGHCVSPTFIVASAAFLRRVLA
ncbi:MAG TPA: hypothetical protein VNE18_00120 [Rhodanobacter sp.]|nr:hypothetical protein [Rhodanobacter sp.]